MKKQDKNKVRLISGPAHALASIVSDKSRKLSLRGDARIVAVSVDHNNVPGALKIVTERDELILAPHDEVILTESYVIR